MSVIDKIKAKAKQNVKHIVLGEGSEPRTVQAARIITDQGNFNTSIEESFWTYGAYYDQHRASSPFREPNS